MTAGTSTVVWSCPKCGDSWEDDGSDSGVRIPRCDAPSCTIYESVIPGGKKFASGTPMERVEV